MAPVNIHSQEYRDLLDIIDRLRSQGISRYVDLPEIIVCGDQSAGKSSVLEAISRLSFPTKDNLCTRFATELIMRRNSNREIKISIIPHHSRTASEKEKLSTFAAEVDPENPDLAPVIEAAKAAMGLTDDADKSAKRFSNDVLRIELSGPEQQHLTLVDLPGIFRAGNSEQSVDEAPAVEKLVLDYMKRPRSIILAVVSAGYDFANQGVTTFSRQVDPDGQRTLGLITKPDKLDKGSESELAFVKLAENRDVKLQLGWHVLKNRGFETRNATSDERDADEADFFSRGVWATANPAHLGVETLRPRLSTVLKNQILAQLPVMLQDISALLADCQHGLSKLGASRATVHEQRQYLMRVSLPFIHLMTSAVDGIYTNSSFFGDTPTESRQDRRLRAVIQAMLTRFSENMHRNGSTREILEDDDNGYSRIAESTRNFIYRSDFVDEVKLLLANTRGRELPGMFSPLVVSELFHQQCQPWVGLAEACVEEALAATQKTISAALDHTAVSETAGRIIQGVVGPAMDELRAALKAKTEELVAPHRDGHPITYNHYLTDNVQKTRHARLIVKLQDVLESFFNVDQLADTKRHNFPSGLDANNLLSMLTANMERDMERQASSDAIDYMEAYYKVALKRFIDDVSVLAIEHCLVAKLPAIFTPDMILDIPDDDITRLAGETEEAVSERAYLLEKKAILERGGQELRRLNQNRPPEPGPVAGSVPQRTPRVSISASENSCDSSNSNLNVMDELADSISQFCVSG